MKVWQKVLIVLLIILVLIQFIRPKRNISAQTSPNDFALVHPIPADVKTILAKACYDCHSNNTRYPWYANFQPVAWWLNNHVQEGKRELNFSEFASYNLRKQYHKMESVVEQVKEGEMPLKSYTLVHTDAKLTDTEKKTIMDWANGIVDSMEAHYPIDSLKRKR